MSSSNLLPDLPNYNPKPADGVRVGESPVPGLTLKRILRGHESWISRIAWSPHGQFLASPSDDETIRIWDVEQGACLKVLNGHNLAQGFFLHASICRSNDNLCSHWQKRSCSNITCSDHW